MKNKNYTWKRNPGALSQEQINAHKDFDELLQNLQNPAPQVPHKAPPVKRLYYLGAVAAALIGVAFFFNHFASDQESSNNTFSEYAATQPYINPPLGEKVQAKFVKHQINGQSGGIYENENGSRLIVPPAAFTNSQGQTVKGEVDIRFREFHDYVDFFLSGIPMEYDSAGTTYHLESAGMVEIYAEQNGQRLNMAPGKSIEVELVSAVNLKKGEAIPSFNVYYLDTENRNWVYEGIDRITPIDDPSANELLSEEDQINQDFQQEMQKIETKQQRQIAEIEASLPKPLAPVKPQRANGSGQVFDFSFEENQIDYGTNVPSAQQEQIRNDEQALQQLRSQYANTMWQVSPNNTEFPGQAVKSVTWDDMKLKFVGGQDYELTLLKGERSLSFLVNPVLTGQHYDKALAEFNRQQAEYEQQITRIEASLAGKKAELKRLADEEKRLAEASFQQRIEEYKAKGMHHRATDETIQQKIVNRFTAQRLGVWNCDRPLPPAIFALKCDFKGADDSDYNQNIAYLVDKGRNTVARFYTKKGCKMDFDIGSENLLWLVTKDNKIAIYPPEDFKKIKKVNKSRFERTNHTFVMNLVDKPIETEEDIRKILEF